MRSLILKLAAKMPGGKRGASKMSAKVEATRILVDMDGVMCDFEGHFLKTYREKYPDMEYIPLEERNIFYVNEQYRKISEKAAECAKSVYQSKGFFRTIPPIPDAIETVKELSGEENLEVLICTSPLSRNYEHMVSEKFQWVEEHMGLDWTRRIILTADKTVVNGHLLIDDKDNIKGILDKPTWKHVLFTACQNTRVNYEKLPNCIGRLDNWAEGEKLKQFIAQSKQ